MPRLRHLFFAPLLTVGLAGLPALASTPEQLIAANCGGCHADPENPAAPYSRMTEQRKTPEGWEMTLFRMQHVHGVPFTDPAEELSPDAVMRVLVRHFADTRGLAPAESAPYRYILEQRLNTIEQTEDPLYARMCARCHSEARVGLQRRSEQEWRHLVHFHLAQFPSIEFSAGGRDRDWRGIAFEQMVPLLTDMYGPDEQAWADWQDSVKPEPEGRWRVTGYMHARGALDAVMTASAAQDGMVDLRIDGQFANGEPFNGTGKAQVFSGYEWRGSLKIGEHRYKQVLALSTDGSGLTGRMYQTEHSELGLEFSAARDTGSTQLLAAVPASLRSGEEQSITLLGTHLGGGTPVLGEGLQLLEVTSTEPDRMTFRVKAATTAAEGTYAVSIAGQALPGGLTIYRAVDRIEVSPQYAVGRVGGNGGSQATVHAMFDAIGWSAGPDGVAQTEDDVRIGPLPAQWRVAPWDDQAERDGDVHFAGKMNSETGLFTPGLAGPNPERKYGTNNAGNLKVIASVEDQGASLEAEGHLLVTVQRWNNPPIP